MTVGRRTGVIRRAGTVNKTVDATVETAVVNFSVKTRRVHISSTLGQDPQRVRARVISIVMIKGTRLS